MAQILNLLGQRFGRLTVIARAPNTADGRAVWECRCDCGSTKVVTAKMLRDGKTSSCGCYRRERQSKVRRRELKGMRFGMLEVVKEMGLNRHGYYTWQGGASRMAGIGKGVGGNLSQIPKRSQHGNWSILCVPRV